MADGMPTAGWNAALDWYFGTHFTVFDVQLHTAAPGAAGTTSIAGNSTRQAIATLASAASASKASSAAVTWTSVSTAETYSHFSQWDASTAGNFEVSGSVTASAVSVGDTFTIPSGSLTYAGTPAS